MKTLLLAMLLILPLALVAGSDLPYKDAKTELNGFVAGSDASSASSGQALRPGILIVHQWMGLTDYEKGRAEQIAKELGYVVLAADIYGKDAQPKDTKEAGAQAGKYKGDRALYRSRLKAGLEALKKQPNVDPKRLAVIGYCFGGTGALEAARAGLPVKGVVSFHGGLATDKPAKSPLKAKVLVLHGAIDPYVGADEVAGFEKEMNGSKADWQLVKYSGAVHAFTQPMAGNDISKGAAYNAAADKRSWQAMRAFFDEIFNKP